MLKSRIWLVYQRKQISGSVIMEHNRKWYHLDNAAKIIPSTAKGGIQEFSGLHASLMRMWT